MSAIPSLVMIPVASPRRSSTALRPSVVPWMNRPTSARSVPRASIAAITPRHGCAGVVDAFLKRIRSVRWSSSIASTNVPPMSTEIW
jgi:hypothetical protein